MVKEMWKPQGQDVLWVSASPSLKFFDLPLLQKLTKTRSIARWEYAQSLDEASSLAVAVTMLVDYLQQSDRPVHLAGHGLSGVVAMMAAAQCPEKVQSIALLSTSVLPGLTWQAHYYLQRLSTPCSQTRILANCARSLWGPATPYSLKSLVSLLEKDLLLSPSPHSLFQVAKLDPVLLSTIPKWVGGGANDFVISPVVYQLWKDQMGPADRLCEVPDGSHFFHTTDPDWVANELIQFWLHHEQQVVSSHLYSDTIPDSQALNSCY
jgi:pimeloyl-ACP methyl ester carboxylesterase